MYNIYSYHLQKKSRMSYAFPISQLATKWIENNWGICPDIIIKEIVSSDTYRKIFISIALY